MTYSAEQITYMLADAIDKDREYKSWHVSTKHLMTLVEAAVLAEREACAKVCEDYGRAEEMQAIGNDYAEAIRARGQA